MNLGTNVLSETMMGRETEVLLSVRLLTEISVSAYFALSFLYYVNALPAGHLMNITFLGIFSSLVVFQGKGAVVRVRDVPLVALLVSLMLVSVLSWILRDDWDTAGLVRSVTWLTPVMLLILLENSPPLRHRAICYGVAVVSIVVNAFVTVVFAKLNPGISKFEVDASWTWISSNELSFHLITFGFLFLVLASRRVVGVLAVIVGFTSFIHLSKAHIVGLVVAPIVAVCRRRSWMAFTAVVTAAIFLRWFALSEFSADLVFPEAVARVFDPIRDMLEVAGSLIVAGELMSFALISDSVGLFRFEVYEGAVDLLPNAWVGYSQAVISNALDGLDPHSNIVYLVLREGWGVLVLYLVATVALMRKIPTATTSGRVVLGVLIYVFIRALFLTFDPTKLICLALYAGAALQFKAHDFHIVTSWRDV